jgi:ABC-type Na+ efflux pump permease subunit
MRVRLKAVFRKEAHQILRSKRTIGAAMLVPALMLIFVTGGDIVTIKLGFGSRPIYLLSSAHAVSGAYLLRHYALPVLVTISALVTPSIVMSDVLLGERERRTFDLLVGLPLSPADIVLAKVAAVGTFAMMTTVPLFGLNTLILTAFAYSSPVQTVALSELLLAAISFSVASALLIALLAGEPRSANIVSGLILGPVVPIEGLILASVRGETAITVCAVTLVLLACLFLLFSRRLLSFERLAGA